MLLRYRDLRPLAFDDKFIAAYPSLDHQSDVPAATWSILAPRSKGGTPAIATTLEAART
jgi:hypothetical protein